jgi:hypothetical protein
MAALIPYARPTRVLGFGGSTLGAARKVRRVVEGERERAASQESNVSI